jgi:hypothetical protein
VKVYVASSWRNPHQQFVVEELRRAGHDVYDFRNPRPGDKGFAWSEIDPDWMKWSPKTFRRCLAHPIAKAGFASDMEALIACDACVLVLPCGRSSHLELGWAAGAGKKTAVLFTGHDEPELMYRMLHNVCVDLGEVLSSLSGVPA